MAIVTTGCIALAPKGDRDFASGKLDWAAHDGAVDKLYGKDAIVQMLLVGGIVNICPRTGFGMQLPALRGLKSDSPLLVTVSVRAIRTIAFVEDVFPEHNIEPYAIRTIPVSKEQRIRIELDIGIDDEDEHIELAVPGIR